MNDDDTLAELRLWERKAVLGLLGLLTMAFLSWAGVVWNSADKLMVKLDSMSEQLATDRVEQQLYRSQVERRLSLNEERIQNILRLMDREKAHE